MSVLTTHGIELYYETHGTPGQPAVLLISGLGGMGASWGAQIPFFGSRYFTIVPDQRGTGRTTQAADGHRTEQLAADMLALVEHLGVGAVHVVGCSTGGAIAQHMALERPDLIRSLTVSSSFAKFDPYLRREFDVRKRMAAEWDRRTLMSAYSLFLFSPRFHFEYPDRVAGWVDRATGTGETTPEEVDIALKRIDMIANHDVLERLGEITTPALVMTGASNACTSLANSEVLAAAIPGAKLVVFEEAGELIETEQPARFFAEVSAFIERI